MGCCRDQDTSAVAEVPLSNLPSTDSSALFYKQEAGKVLAGDLAANRSWICLGFFSSCLLTLCVGEQLFGNEE